MTLTVTLSAPYSNFPAVAGFQLFMPGSHRRPSTAGANWENEVMFGNGPYKMEAARTDQEIVLVKNDEWNGDANQDTWDDRLDSITFKTAADPDTSYNSFEAGEGNNASIPPARVADAEAAYQNTLDVSILGSYHWVIDTDEGVLAGPENLKLRQAISAAIDREEINEAVYNGSRTTSTGVTPDGIPGFAPDLCDYCAYDEAQAQTLYDEWVAEGGELTEPLPLQFNADVGPRARRPDHGRQPRGHRHRSRRRADERGDVLLRPGRRCLQGDLPGRLVRRLPDVRQLHVRPVPHRLDRWQQPRAVLQRGVRPAGRRGQADRRRRRAGVPVPGGRAASC